MAVNWEIRKNNLSHEDVIIGYDGFPNLFSLEIHHGGRITNPPHRVYVGGTVNSVDLVDIDRFSIHELDLMLNELGWSATEPMFYHFLNPTKTLNDGLEDLGCDQDVVNLSRFVGENKVIHVYIQHGLKNMMEFFSSPSKIRPKISIEEIDDPNPYAIVPTQKNSFHATSSSHNDQVSPADSDPFDFNFANDHGNTDQESQDNDGDFEADAGRTTAELVTQDGVSIDQEALEFNSEVVSQEVSDGNANVDGAHADVPDADVEDLHNVEAILEVDVAPVVAPDVAPDVEPDVAPDVAPDVEPDVAPATPDDDLSLPEDDLSHPEETDGEESDDSHDIDYDEAHNNMEDDINVDMADYETYVDQDVPDEILEDEDLEILDNEILLSGSESDEHETSQRKRFLHKVRETKQKKEIDFYLGQLFGTKEEAKDLVKAYSVQTRRKLKIQKNDSERLRVICVGDMPDFVVDDSGVLNQSQGKGKNKVTAKESKSVDMKARGGRSTLGRGKKTKNEEQCTFHLYIGKVKNQESWVVKTLINEHKCLQSRQVKACTAEYISKQMVDQIEENPHIPVKAVQEQFQKKLELGISKMKAYRARMMAKTQLLGDYRQQYELLWDYANELRSKNPDTTVRVEVEPLTVPNAISRQFKRIYICYGALKRGFKALGRDLLGLDGAFMKGPYPGQILTAVGIDNNNGIYPLCFAIVEAESLNSWTWFLQNLGEDLDLNSASNFTFISDRQKGLLPAISKLFPWGGVGHNSRTCKGQGNSQAGGSAGGSMQQGS